MSRSSTNLAVMRALPSVVVAVQLVEAADACESASSSGITTWVVTSSGVAPGSRMLMLTVAGSALREQVHAQVAEGEHAEHHQER